MYTRFSVALVLGLASSLIIATPFPEGVGSPAARQSHAPKKCHVVCDEPYVAQCGLTLEKVKENCETAFRGYHKDGKDHDHHNDHNEQSGPSGQGGQTGQTGSTGSTGSTSHTSKRDAALTPCAVDCTKSFSQCGFSTEELKDMCDAAKKHTGKREELSARAASCWVDCSNPVAQCGNTQDEVDSICKGSSSHNAIGTSVTHYRRDGLALSPRGFCVSCLLTIGAVAVPAAVSFIKHLF